MSNLLLTLNENVSAASAVIPVAVNAIESVNGGTAMRIRVIYILALTVLASTFAGFVSAQEAGVVRITRQPSIIYMPSHIMEKQELVQKHAAKLGVANLKAEWVTLSGGGVSTDALLSGSVDVVNTGVGNMLLLWDRTRGNVKGIVATSALPLILVSRNPAIKTLKDFTPTDKIAVPTVKVSTQAILLQIASRKLFGDDQGYKLDGNTVQLGHPDAAAAMANAGHEVTSHFSAPPYVFQTLKSVPNAHVVTTSDEIIGSPLTVALMFTTTKFADANPKIIQAVRAAAEEALAMIRSDPQQAVAIYKEVTGDKMPAADVLEMLKRPGMTAFDTPPQGTMIFAEHLFTVGTLKTRPKSWKDYFLASAHDLRGS